MDGFGLPHNLERSVVERDKKAALIAILDAELPSHSR
jgi:hypothetical protein